MSRKTEADEIEALAHLLAAEEDDEPFDPGRRAREQQAPKVWLPRLNLNQQLSFNDPSDVVISYGPKYTGKGVGHGHKIFRHCWQEWDAMFLIIGVSAEALGQGICHDLQTLVGPTWRDGNREPMYLRQDGLLVPNPRAGELMDDGLGLEFSRWKIDPVSKRMWMWVQNRHGGRSCIRVASIPHPTMIEDRITGPAFSGIMLEEATKCRGPEYFRFPSLQLHRRRDIVGPQQFLMACNPEGPEHWVYELGWVECEVPADQPGRFWPDDPVKPGIRRDPGVSVYFHSYEENAHNVSQKNREIVERALRKDPIQRQRLIEGKWVSYPSGEALFRDQFSEPQHVRGDDKKNIGLLPVPGHPIVVGYDVGSVNTAVSFKQYIPTEDGEVELVFDEFCFYRTRTKVKRIAHGLLEKMRYWTAWLWRHHGWDQDNPPLDAEQNPLPPPLWTFWHIAGDDALTVYNPSKGSTYARDLEDDTRAYIEENPVRYQGLEPIHVRGCPKPPESVKRRVDFTAEALAEGRLVISATCTWHRQMFLHLERDDQEDVPKPGHKYGHTFDACSYPRLYRHLKLPAGFINLDDGPLCEVSAGG